VVGDACTIELRVSKGFDSSTPGAGDEVANGVAVGTSATARRGGAELPPLLAVEVDYRRPMFTK
jgi:hypothetical protein